MNFLRALVPCLLVSSLLLCLAHGSGDSAAGANPAISDYEPAFAVRASSCITCHAEIQPSCITDFGRGEPYFFGRHGSGSTLGTFDGSMYGDFGGEPDKTAWLTARIARQIIVPRAEISFDLKAAAKKLAGQPDFRQALEAKSLAEYLRALESRKPNPAAVVEKEEVFIGAPTAATLEARFNIPAASANLSKYIENDASSPALQGIGMDSGRNFFTNTGEVVCDGDLFLRGTLFLNNLSLATRSGCRIYATGPIFIQKEIHYKDLEGAGRKANLQLVSAEAILLGVGDKSCDPSSEESPLSRRLVSGYAISTFMTREAQRRSISAKEFGEGIYARGKLIPALEDAACHGDDVSFSRLLLNAPQIHNRYKGKFRGLVIGEVALFRLSKSAFEFDPIFKQVPILPVLRPRDYLHVE